MSSRRSVLGGPGATGGQTSCGSTLRRAREVCGGKDIRISGGADLVRQYMNAGVVDELVLSIAPVFLGGKRLFDGIDPKRSGLEIVDVVASPKVTHVRYAVTNEA